MTKRLLLNLDEEAQPIIEEIPFGDRTKFINELIKKAHPRNGGGNGANSLHSSNYGIDRTQSEPAPTTVTAPSSTLSQTPTTPTSSLAHLLSEGFKQKNK